MRDLHLKVFQAPDLLDARELWQQGLDAFGFNLGFIHTAGVEITDLLLVALSRRPVLVAASSRISRNRSQFFSLNTWKHPSWGRLQVFASCDPSAIGILVEVITRAA